MFVSTYMRDGQLHSYVDGGGVIPFKFADIWGESGEAFAALETTVIDSEKKLIDTWRAYDRSGSQDMPATTAILRLDGGCAATDILDEQRQRDRDNADAGAERAEAVRLREIATQKQIEAVDAIAAAERAEELAWRATGKNAKAK